MVLEDLRKNGETWEVLAARWGVTNPDPTWKTSLIAMCDCLGDTGALDSLERRNEEDHLADTVFSDVPAPERQLLALSHSMIHRGLISEEALAERMKKVRDRLEAV